MSRSRDRRAKLVSRMPGLSSATQMKNLPKDRAGVSGSNISNVTSTVVPSKRQKTAATDCISGFEATGASKVKRTRGRRGILKELTEMPLDVLFEVCKLISPRDLVINVL